LNQKIVNSKPELESHSQQEAINHCKNCGAQYSGCYCSDCGQSSNTGVITLSGAFSNLISHFTDLDNKLFYTLRHMFLNPGTASLNYVLGQRVKYIHPIKYFIIAMGLNLLAISEMQSQGTLTASKLQLPEFIDIPEQEKQAIVLWVAKYAHMLMVALLPIYGYFLSLLFDKKRTAGESTAFLFYLYANLALVSFLVLLFTSVLQSQYLHYVSSLFFIVYSSWAILKFFEMRFSQGFWRIGVSYLCYSLVALILILGVFKGYEIWLNLS
jgi:hypothetical protein